MLKLLIGEIETLKLNNETITLPTSIDEKIKANKNYFLDFKVLSIARTRDIGT
jgi:hypothetical protein